MARASTRARTWRPSPNASVVAALTASMAPSETANPRRPAADGSLADAIEPRRREGATKLRFAQVGGVDVPLEAERDLLAPSRPDR
jgi:hypothetical protein